MAIKNTGNIEDNHEICYRANRKQGEEILRLHAECGMMLQINESFKSTKNINESVKQNL